MFQTICFILGVPRRRIIALQLLALPIIWLDIQTPKSRGILVGLIIYSSKQVHHVVEHSSWMSRDIVEWVIVQKICITFMPVFIWNIVSIDSFLLIKMIFCFWTRYSSIYKNWWFVYNWWVKFSLSWLIGSLICILFIPIS